MIGYYPYHILPLGPPANHGHQSPALLFNTYRTLAKEEDGLAYFEIRP